MNTFEQNYIDQNFQFPEGLTYEQFEQIQHIQVRADIARKNKVTNTDSYNRTMTQLRGDLGEKLETFTLSLRRAGNEKYIDMLGNQPYNVIYGVNKIVDQVLSRQITQSEIDFAAEYYKAQGEKGGLATFDKEMWQSIVDEYDGYIPLKVHAVADGTVLKKGEPAMRVEGPGELAAVYEPLLLRIFFMSAVATEARTIKNLVGEDRIMEFGKRAAINEEAHLDALEALQVGLNIKLTSNDTGALVYPETKTSGTTAHRYFASYETEDAAFINAIETADSAGLLVDLIDSYKGIDKILKLKQEYRESGKAITMRLDSGDIKDQAVYALTQQLEMGMMDPKRDKIVVADISTVEEIAEVEQACAEALQETGYDYKEYIIYGLGGLLVSRDKTRDVVSGGYKLTHTEDGPTGKKSNTLAKRPIPGKPNIGIDETNEQRMVVQEGEELDNIDDILLKEVYNHGEVKTSGYVLQNIQDAKKQVDKTMQYIAYEQVDSPETIKAKEAVEKKLAA